MIEIINSKQPLLIDDIRRIEAKMRAVLPAPYRAFLLTHNGGRPNPDAIDIPHWPMETTDVNAFYGVAQDHECYDIFWTLDSLEGCVENQLLPIASDSMANQFILVLDDNDYGQVLYFDAAVIPPRPYFVANNFNEFLDKIRAMTPEELADIEEAAQSDDNAEPFKTETTS